MMLKGLFYRTYSQLISFFSMPNFWGHWMDLNQTWTHSLMTCYSKNFVRTRLGIYPHRLGEKPFLAPTLNFDWTYLCNGTYQQLKRNLSIYMDSPTCSSNLVNFGRLTAENSWLVFVHLLNFCIGRHCQPYRMDVI